jgi:outer membrane protein insertion porin family
MNGIKLRLGLLISILCFMFHVPCEAQINVGEDHTNIDFTNPKTYEIGGITVSGAKYLDNNILISLSGLTVGDKIDIPGDKVSKAVQNLWKQGLFENIQINATKVQGDLIFLDIFLEEKPRLSKFNITGVKKSEANSMRDKIKIAKGDVVTENLLIRTTNTIKNHYTDKGYMNTSVNITQKRDSTASNSVILFININKNKKFKINQITFSGNQALSDKKLKHLLKKTREHKFYRIFTPSKFIDSDYKSDKQKIIEKYNELGYRDAKIIKDTISKLTNVSHLENMKHLNRTIKRAKENRYINIDISVDEGHKYYYRNLTWVGNTKYTSEELSNVLHLKKGEIYNQKKLDANLYMNLDGADVSSLYLDDGYLFFNVTPVEKHVENDSIDIEFHIYEGKQARVNKVYISGNTKTEDHVILREIKTRPGQLFNRSDIIRSQRELAQLKYFNAEKIQINPKPNPQDGTVDIEYVVEETSSDQLELSGGWGGAGLIGTLGVSFNNFSLKKFTDRNAWRPLPSGDGQKVSLRIQTNGSSYQSYNASFTEPWLGGRKPNALSFSIYSSTQTNGLAKGEASRQAIYIYGLSLGLGKRIKWPDDFFTLYMQGSYQNYKLENYTSTFVFGNGEANNLFGTITLSRNSIDAPIFARSGSSISLGLQITPPYSYIFFKGTDYSKASPEKKYRWLEYHKWNFSSSWFTKLAGSLVLNTRIKYGFLSYFNPQIGSTPFERFYLGGDGLSGFQLDGREIIALRGYENQTLTPRDNAGNYLGGTVFDKYTVELHYPLSLNPMATIYVLGFAEAGNSWVRFTDFNAFDVKRSAGLGLRVFLPMFGLLGLDYGYGFDDIPGLPTANKGHFHFSIGQSIE